MANGMIESVSKEAVLEIKDSVFELYKQELYAQQLYLGQIRKLEGSIVEILKVLSAQEEVHAETLKILLNKANIETKSEYETIPQSKLNEPLVNAIKIDINAEEDATLAYTKAISKSTDDAMKKLLTHILGEEEIHVKLLKNYFEKNK